MLFGRFCGITWNHRGIHTAAGTELGTSCRETCQCSQVTAPSGLCSSNSQVWVDLPTACHPKLCNCFCNPEPHSMRDFYTNSDGREYIWTREILLSLPVRMGDIWIQDPEESTQRAYTTLTDSTSTISASIKGRTEFSIQSACKTTWRTEDQWRGKAQCSTQTQGCKGEVSHTESS